MGVILSSERRLNATVVAASCASVAAIASYAAYIYYRPKHRELTDAEIRAEVAGLPTLEAKVSFGGGTHNVKSAESNDQIPVIIRDGRADVGRFKLDTHGFQLVPAPGLGFDQNGQLLDLYNADVHYKEFQPRCAELVQKIMKGATRVIPFDHIVRNPLRLEEELEALESALLAAGENTVSGDSPIERRNSSPPKLSREISSESSQSSPVRRSKSIYSIKSTAPCLKKSILRQCSKEQFTHALLSTEDDDSEDGENECPIDDLPKMTKFLHGALAKAHGDYTERSGPARAKQLLEPFVGKRRLREALKSRFAIVNVWYPFKTVKADPLGLVTWHSALPSMVRTNRLYFAHRVGETYKVNFDLRQNWVYFSEVTNQEAILLKVFDSSRDVSRFTIHSAFRLPEQDRREMAGEPPLPVRESTEVRCLVLFGEGLEDLATDFVAPHMRTVAAGTEIKGGVLRNQSLIFDDGKAW